MIKVMTMNRSATSFLVLSCSVATMIFFSSRTEALTRPVFSPGDNQAMILMQGISATEPADMDPRRLYEAMALAPTDVSGGQGKGVKTSAGDFNLSCVARPALPEDVLCSMVVKKSARSVISSRDQSAVIRLDGAEAAEFFASFAGSDSTEDFLFKSEDGQTEILSTPTQFVYSFKKKP